MRTVNAIDRGSHLHQSDMSAKCQLLSKVIFSIDCSSAKAIFSTKQVLNFFTPSCEKKKYHAFVYITMLAAINMITGSSEVMDYIDL